MDRGYDPRVGSSLDAQEIDSEQLLNLTLQTHGSGGSFFVRSSEPVQLFVIPRIHQFHPFRLSLQILKYL